MLAKVEHVRVNAPQRHRAKLVIADNDVAPDCLLDVLDKLSAVDLRPGFRLGELRSLDGGCGRAFAATALQSNLRQGRLDQILDVQLVEWRHAARGRSAIRNSLEPPPATTSWAKAKVPSRTRMWRSPSTAAPILSAQASSFFCPGERFKRFKTEVGNGANEVRSQPLTSKYGLPSARTLPGATTIRLSARRSMPGARTVDLSAPG